VSNKQSKLRCFFGGHPVFIVVILMLILKIEQMRTWRLAARGRGAVASPGFSYMALMK